MRKAAGNKVCSVVGFIPGKASVINKHVVLMRLPVGSCTDFSCAKLYKRNSNAQIYGKKKKVKKKI